MAKTRRLIIMRHAEAVPGGPGTSDRDRPLTDAGRLQARRVAAELSNMGWIPELILASDARRTRETYEELASGFFVDLPCQLVRSFYLGGMDEILSELAALGDDVESVLILGHNPGWSEAVSQLTAKPCGLPTAGAALLSGGGEPWLNAVATGGWRLEKLLDRL